MDFTTLAFSLSKARKPWTRTVAAENAFYAANSGDWLDFLARSSHLPHSVERELRQMTTAKGWAKLS